MYQPQKILDPGLRSLLGVLDTLSGSTLFVSYSKYSKRVKIGIYFYQSRYLRDTGVQYKVLLEAGWILWSWLIFSWNSVRKPRWFAIKGDEVLPQKEWLKELFSTYRCCFIIGTSLYETSGDDGVKGCNCPLTLSVWRSLQICCAISHSLRWVDKLSSNDLVQWFHEVIEQQFWCHQYLLPI